MARRFRRRRRATEPRRSTMPGFPVRAIRACFDFAGVKAADLDFVCFGWQKRGALFRHDLKCFAQGSPRLTALNLVNSTRYLASVWHQQGGEKPFLRNFGPTRAQFRFVDHHLAHAISAYAFSGFDDAAVLVIDGRGAWEATSLWRGSGGSLEHVFTIPWPNSLGLFLRAIHAISRLRSVQRRVESDGSRAVRRAGRQSRAVSSIRMTIPIASIRGASLAAIPRLRQELKSCSARRASPKVKSAIATRMSPTPCRMPAKPPCSRSFAPPWQKRNREICAWRAASRSIPKPTAKFSFPAWSIIFSSNPQRVTTAFASGLL